MWGEEGDPQPSGTLPLPLRTMVQGLTPSKDRCSGGLFQALRGGPVGGVAVGGAFLYKDETLWGLVATVIHHYGKPLQKLFCLSHPPRPPGSQVRGWPASEPLQGTPVYCLLKANVKDRPGWELKLLGRERAQM